MNVFAQSAAVARKDLAIELRTRESLQAAGAFSIVILMLFSFAFDPSADEIKTMGGGLLWLCFAFAGALIFNRGFARELPNECLDALLASPLSASSIIIGKAITSVLLLMVVELASLFVFGVFYNTNWVRQPLELFTVFALSTWSIAILGSVFGAMTVNLRSRELMLPVIIYPLLIPVLIGAIELTNTSISGDPWREMDWLWARILLICDIVFTSLAVALAETILVN